MELICTGLQCKARNSEAGLSVFRRRVERHHVKLPHHIGREVELTKITGQGVALANNSTIELELRAATLAAIYRGIQLPA